MAAENICKFYEPSENSKRYNNQQSEKEINNTKHIKVQTQKSSKQLIMFTSLQI